MTVDQQKLYASDDAQVWAEEWCKIAREIQAADGQVVDEGWMIGWFANAMFTAVDHDRRRRQIGDEPTSYEGTGTNPGALNPRA